MRRGKVVGGLANPELFSLADAQEWIRDVPKNTKIVKIRVTHEVIAEVIV
jgi:S-adenosylmethionine:diacylglycerol 3-amino-3-carboxypropyl transferase